MPAPRDIPPKIPAPRAKIRMQKPQSGGEFSVQIPGGARGGWSWQKLITALQAAKCRIYSESDWLQETIGTVGIAIKNYTIVGIIVEINL